MPSKMVRATMYCIFGDLHGDIDSLRMFVDYVRGRDDITRLFFTGDFFGMRKGISDISAERHRQYCTITDILKDVRVPIHAVPGNYDCRFDKFFARYNCHHVLSSIDRHLFFGHGGSYHPPTDIPKDDPSFPDCIGQDVEHEYRNLSSFRPKLVLSHNPIRKYNYHFLEGDLGELFCFSGHNHTRTFLDVFNKESHVRVIKPGALGKTLNSANGRYLPQSFMLYDLRDPDTAVLAELQDGSVSEKMIHTEKISLQEYRDSEGRWLRQK